MKRKYSFLLVTLALFLLTFSVLAQVENWTTFVPLPLPWLAPAQQATPRPTPAPTALSRPQPYEDFDIRATHQRSLAVAPTAGTKRNQASTEGTASALEQWQQAHPQARLRWSSLTGAPSQIVAQTEALTPPSAEDAEAVARRFLQQDLFQLENTAEALRVARRDQTAHNGMTHLTLQQQVNGIEVFGARMTVHLTRAGEIIAANGELIPKAMTVANSARPQLAATTALTRATEAVGVTVKTRPRTTEAATGTAQQQRFTRTTELAREVNARLVYFPLAADKLQLAWEFEVWPADSADAYLTIIDAERGSLLYRRNLTCYEAPHGLVYTGDSPRPESIRTRTTKPPTSRARGCAVSPCALQWPHSLCLE